MVIENIVDPIWLGDLRYAFEKVLQIEGFTQGRVIDAEALSMGDLIAKEFSRDNVSYMTAKGIIGLRI